MGALGDRAPLDTPYSVQAVNNDLARNQQLQSVREAFRFLPTVQVGITLVSIIEGTFGGARIAGGLTPYLERVPALRPFAGELALALVVIVITSLMLVLGELVPKQLALRHPETIAARLALPLLMLARVTSPVVWVLGWASALVLRLAGISGDIALGTRRFREDLQRERGLGRLLRTRLPHLPRPLPHRLPQPPGLTRQHRPRHARSRTKPRR